LAQFFMLDMKKMFLESFKKNNKLVFAYFVKKHAFPETKVFGVFREFWLGNGVKID
jgi:hypothetical protein